MGSILLGHSGQESIGVTHAYWLDGQDLSQIADMDQWTVCTPWTLLVHWPPNIYQPINQLLQRTPPSRDHEIISSVTHVTKPVPFEFWTRTTVSRLVVDVGCLLSRTEMTKLTLPSLTGSLGTRDTFVICYWRAGIGPIRGGISNDTCKVDMHSSFFIFSVSFILLYCTS